MQPQSDALGDGGASHTRLPWWVALGQFGGEFGGVMRIDLARQLRR
jgi:aconitase B